MVDLYLSQNLNEWNLLSVRHFVYKLLFQVHLPRFGDILIWINRSINIVVSFYIWHSDPYMDRLRPSREYTQGVMADKKQFLNTKSIVKVETGIVTLISYRHYLKIVGNNKLWPDMQKESWNIHLTKILICSHMLNRIDS
jgi:hypothetical protein